MFAKIKPSIFIDALQLELTALNGNSLRGVLRDDNGSVCSTLKKDIEKENEQLQKTTIPSLLTITRS